MKNHDLRLQIGSSYFPELLNGIEPKLANLSSGVAESCHISFFNDDIKMFTLRMCLFYSIEL